MHGKFIGVLIVFASAMLNGCGSDKQASDVTSVKNRSGIGVLWVRSLVEGDNESYCWYEYKGEFGEPVDTETIKAGSKPLGTNAYNHKIKERVVSTILEDLRKKSKVSPEIEKRENSDHQSRHDVELSKVLNASTVIKWQELSSRYHEESHIKRLDQVTSENYESLRSLVVKIHEASDLPIKCALRS